MQVSAIQLWVKKSGASWRALWRLKLAVSQGATSHDASIALIMDLYQNMCADKARRTKTSFRFWMDRWKGLRPIAVFFLKMEWRRDLWMWVAVVDVYLAGEGPDRLEAIRTCVARPCFHRGDATGLCEVVMALPQDMSMECMALLLQTGSVSDMFGIKPIVVHLVGLKTDHAATLVAHFLLRVKCAFFTGRELNAILPPLLATYYTSSTYLDCVRNFISVPIDSLWVLSNVLVCVAVAVRESEYRGFFALPSPDVDGYIESLRTAMTYASYSCSMLSEDNVQRTLVFCMDICKRLLPVAAKLCRNLYDCLMEISTFALEGTVYLNKQDTVHKAFMAELIPECLTWIAANPERAFVDDGGNTAASLVTLAYFCDVKWAVRLKVLGPPMIKYSSVALAYALMDGMGAEVDDLLYARALQDIVATFVACKATIELTPRHEVQLLSQFLHRGWLNPASVATFPRIVVDVLWSFVFRVGRVIIESLAPSLVSLVDSYAWNDPRLWPLLSYMSIRLATPVQVVITAFCRACANARVEWERKSGMLATAILLLSPQNNIKFSKNWNWLMTLGENSQLLCGMPLLASDAPVLKDVLRWVCHDGLDVSMAMLLPADSVWLPDSMPKLDAVQYSWSLSMARACNDSFWESQTRAWAPFVDRFAWIKCCIQWRRAKA